MSCLLIVDKLVKTESKLFYIFENKNQDKMKVKFSAFLAIPAVAVLLSGCSKGGGGYMFPLQQVGIIMNPENGGFEVSKR